MAVGVVSLMKVVKFRLVSEERASNFERITSRITQGSAGDNGADRVACQCANRHALTAFQ